MKVLHLISGGDTGGAKTHVFALLRALSKKADVKIVCFMKGVFFDELQDIDVESELIEQKSRFDLSVLKRLYEIAEDGFDVIHSHGARANFLCAHLKNKVKIPIVTTIHSDFLLDFDGIYKKIVYTGLNVFSLRKLENFIAVSSNFKSMLISRGFKPNSIYTVYNGMDYSSEMTYQPKEEFAKRLDIEYDPSLVYIGLIGRHDYVKGHDVFVKACAEAAKKCDRLRFLIAGDGDLRGELVRLAKEGGIEDKLIFTGFLKDIYSFINFIDINTLTSRSESFPYVLMEGARMKKPTISSRVGGIPDLIEDGKTGLLFESENYSELADKMIMLANDKNMREELGGALYDRATSTFSSENLANTHIDIYNSILHRSKEKCEYDVVISGYYGFENSGDDALLKAMIESLQMYMPHIRILVLSESPKSTKQTFNVDSRRRFNLFMVIRSLKDAKMLINGGGSLIQDATSSQSLYYYLWVMHMAKKLGLKVYMYANGIGPIKSRNAKLVSKIVNKADLITLRDRISAEELERLGVTRPEIQITADPAIILKPASAATDKIFEAEKIPANKKYIGISVRSWSKSDDKFSSKIAELADYAYEKYGLVPVFIPMRYPVDAKCSEAVVSAMKNKAYIIQDKYSVTDTIAIVQKMELVIGMRLHTLIYAASGGVPLIGLIYDPKNKGFMDYIGQTRMASVENIDTEKIKRYIDEIATDDGSIRRQTEEKCLSLADLALKNAELAKELLEK